MSVLPPRLERLWVQAFRISAFGLVERTLFIIDHLLDANMQRCAQIGLNKGEGHHALKNVLRIGRQGDIRDRTSEGQHCRRATLNLLALIFVYWNTKHLGNAVADRGLPPSCPKTRDNHGPVQIPAPDTTVSIRARRGHQSVPLEAPPSIRRFLPPRKVRRVPAVDRQIELIA